MRSLRRRIVAWIAIALATLLCVGVVPTMASAADDLTGAIEGIVTDELGAPLAGVPVRIAIVDREAGYIDGVTDGDGRYRFDQLTPADYVVRFDGHAVGKQGEHYADAPTRFTATPVTVVAGHTTAGIDAELSGTSILRGTVTDAETGDPVALARVTLYEKQGEYWQGLQTTAYADRRGRYEFDGVWGTYRLLVTTGSYGTHDYTFHPDALSVEDAESVSVAAGAEVVVDVALPKGAGTSTITGTVTASGEGRAGIDVQAEHLYGGEWSTRYATTTDATGHYRVFAPYTGTYRLRFSDPTGKLPDRWWDAESSAAEATPIVIETAGSTFTAVDMDLSTAPATGPITGTVTGPRGAPAPDIDVTAYEWDDAIQRWTDVGAARTDASGSYVVADLPVGTYRVGFDDSTDHLVTEYHRDSHDLAGATDVEVTDAAGATVDAEMAPLPGDITGYVSRAGTGSVADLRVVAYARRDGAWVPVAEDRPAADGLYLLLDLPPDTYRVGFHDDAGTHVDQYWRDQPTLEEAEDVVVRPNDVKVNHDATLRPVVTASPSPSPSPSESPSPSPSQSPWPSPTTSPSPTVLPAPAPGVETLLSQVATDLVVRGRAKVGRTVRVKHLVAHVRTGVSYRFRWYLRGEKIKKAKRSRLRITPAMAGKSLKVRVAMTAGGAREVVTIRVGRVRT